MLLTFSVYSAQNLTSEQRESRRANMARLHAHRAATIAKENMI